jgi:transposase
LFVFIFGIDPNKGSHTAAVIDGDEQVVGEVSVCADRRQCDRLLCWAARSHPRLWAVEGASGPGALLTQQLVASGETVVDVPAALSARARLLDSGRKDKTDAHDALSAAIVAAPESAVGHARGSPPGVAAVGASHHQLEVRLLNPAWPADP